MKPTEMNTVVGREGKEQNRKQMKIVFFDPYRFLYFQEMSLALPCQSLVVSNTRMGNTYSCSAQQSPHLNGEDYLSVHILMVGDWTNKLKKVFTEDDSSACEIGRVKFRQRGNVDQRGLPRLLVDGPYGAQHRTIKIMMSCSSWD
ncbi:hypothetical protein CQW23_04116 [Capsicum baccatum]|uniref:FAD-binding 8 domain-containing protein n=1 Tax=Capsicum baccatum TaxID=33114 RepID=A0A2G2XDT6_CAPBA|nr:hypothetical protein CQW23_04116 [Capsicum baccatum]